MSGTDGEWRPRYDRIDAIVRNVIGEPAIVLRMPPHNVAFAEALTQLVDEVVQSGDVELAIECLQVMDEQRKRLDRMQATPPARR